MAAHRGVAIFRADATFRAPARDAVSLKVQKG